MFVCLGSFSLVKKVVKEETAELNTENLYEVTYELYLFLRLRLQG